jgi:hypothetical protein
MADPTEAVMAALFARIMTLPNAPPIAWPNVSFTRPADGRFLRVQFVPNATNRRFIGSDDPHQYLGLLQISAYDKLIWGEHSVRQAAGQVAAHFPTDLRLGEIGVRITKRPNVSDMIIEEDRVQVPVMIEWECYA